MTNKGMSSNKGQKSKNVKKTNKTRSNKPDTPFSSDDTVIIAVILVAVMAIALFGIHNATKETTPSPTSTPASTPTDITCPNVYAYEVKKASEDYGIEKERIYAVMRVESNFKPKAVSRADARGLTQMLPSTYKELCDKRGVKYNVEDLFNPAVSIDFGMYYLKWLYDYFGDWDLAHMAYNAGIGNVKKWLENPEYCKDGKIVYIPVTQTREYVKQINYYYNEYKN